MTALASPDEAVAREALDYLFDGSRTFLDRYLRHACNLKDADVRADVAQMSFVRLWSSRGAFENQGSNAWRGWLQRTASRCHVDYLRSRRWLASEDEFDLHAIPSEERPVIDAILTAVESDTLFRLADIFFLDLDPNITPRMHDRRLLAAELFYVDGEKWPTVVRLLGPPSPGEPPLTRQELDRWLADAGVLRHLVFRALYYDNDRLAAHLLGWPEMAGEERGRALDSLMRRATESDAADICDETDREFSWAAVRVLLWRFRHALLDDQIRNRADQTLTEEQLGALIARCAADFPFADLMAEMTAKIVPDGSRSAEKALFAVPGLWQRLAFEYWYRENIPHNDIRDRMQPAANRVGYDVTRGMLNVWLSNGRLVRRLAHKYQEMQGDIEGETQYV